MDDTTEQLLREFLVYTREIERDGMDPRNLYGLMQKVVDEQQKHSKDDEHRFGEIKDDLGAIRGDIRGQSLRIGALEKQVEKIEKDVDTTGEHNVAQLNLQLEEAKKRAASHAEFVRNTFASIVLLVFGSVVTYLLSRGK